MPGRWDASRWGGCCPIGVVWREELLLAPFCQCLALTFSGGHRFHHLRTPTRHFTAPEAHTLCPALWPVHFSINPLAGLPGLHPLATGLDCAIPIRPWQSTVPEPVQSQRRPPLPPTLFARRYQNSHRVWGKITNCTGASTQTAPLKLPPTHTGDAGLGPEHSWHSHGGALPPAA